MNRRFAIAAVFVAGVVAIVRWRAGGSHDPAASSESAPRAGSARDIAIRVDPRTLSRAQISGTVTDEARAPVPHARVCADGSNEQLPTSVTRDPHCVIADDHGVYTIANLYVARYSVYASARPYRPARYWSGDENVLELQPGERRTAIDLVLRTGGVEITGIVSDVTGGPIAHALVTAYDQDAESTIEADPGGHFTMWVAPGTVRLNADADGYTHGWNSGAAPGTFEFWLMPESSITGTVVDAKTGAPVEGVEVAVNDRADSGWIGRTRDLTDEHGHFQIDRLDPGRYFGVARASHGYGRSEGSIAVALRQHLEDVTLRLHRAMRVEGRVVVAGTPPTPCPHPSVSLSNPGHELSSGRGTSRDGTVAIESLLPGTYQVSVHCEGFVPHDTYSTVTIRDQDLTGLTWEVVRGGVIRGHVFDASGAPIAGAEVTDQNTSNHVLSKHDGSYELGGLPAGRRLVLARDPTSAVASSTPWNVNLAERGVVEKDLALDQQGRITGVVAYRDGAPAANVDVTIETADGYWDSSSTTQTRTDRDGAFTFGRLPPGSYRVHAFSTDLIAVRGNETTRLRFTTERPGTIRGTVVDALGHPVIDAFVAYAREDKGAPRVIPREDWLGDKPDVTNTEGAFVLGGLSPGNYTLRAYRPGDGEGIVEHIAVGGTVRVQIKPTALLEGTVHQRPMPDDLHVKLYDAKTQCLREERFFGTGGRYAVHDLPAGHYQVTVRTEHGRTQALVDLVQDEHKGADFDLDGGGTIVGRVVDLATNQPVAGIALYTVVGEGPTRVADPNDHPTLYTSDSSGRFRIEHAPSGPVEIFAVPKDRATYDVVSIVRQIDDSGTVDVGDIGVVPRRWTIYDSKGVLGISWAEAPRETPSDQRSFTITALDPKGPAARTGLRVGDVVTKIDGIDVTGNNRSSGWSLMDAAPGTPISFGLARGVTVVVVTAAAQ